MMSINKVILLTLFVSLVCGVSVFAMEIEGLETSSPSIKVDTSLNTDDDPKQSQQPRTNESSASDDLKKELEQAQLKAQIAALKKQAAQDELEASKAKAERDRIAQAKKEEEKKAQTRSSLLTSSTTTSTGSKQTKLEALANAPRPPSTATNGKVFAHNIQTETARGVICLSNALKGKGWKWK